MIIRIKDLRREHAMTQEALADALGLSRQSVNAMEAGRCLPSLPVALELAKYFKVPVQTIFLMSEEDELPRELVTYMGGAATSEPAVNVAHDERAVYVEMMLPGYSRDDVSIELAEDAIVLSGEKQQSRMSAQGFVRQEFVQHRFRRLIQLPASIIPDQAQAKMEDGILYVLLPKAGPAEPKMLKLRIS